MPILSDEVTPKASTIVRTLAAGLLVLASAESSAVRPVAATPSALLSTPEPRQIHLDLDGDGLPDQGNIVSDVRLDLALTSIRSVRSLVAGDHDRILGVTAVDIDRDGDLDLVARLAGGGFAVWINEGHGDFERASGRRGPPVTLSASSSLTALLPLVAGFVTPRTPVAIFTSSSFVVVLPRPPTTAHLDDTFVASTLDPARPVRAPPASALL
jgi:hypothetical protein